MYPFLRRHDLFDRPFFHHDDLIVILDIFQDRLMADRYNRQGRIRYIPSFKQTGRFMIQRGKRLVKKDPLPVLCHDTCEQDPLSFSSAHRVMIKTDRPIRIRMRQMHPGKQPFDLFLPIGLFKAIFCASVHGKSDVFCPITQSVLS